MPCNHCRPTTITSREIYRDIQGYTEIYRDIQGYAEIYRYIQHSTHITSIDIYLVVSADTVQYLHKPDLTEHKYHISLYIRCGD